MHTTKFLLVPAVAAFLTACNHVEATHNRCGGTMACAKTACDPIDVLSDRPSRPFKELGVVEVRVDRGTALSNTTLADAMPALMAEGRAMGADAIILTHEEFTSWYDKGEPASPIHDLERQESWYITEKARYVSGVAVVYTAPVCACPTPAPRTAMPTSSMPVAPAAGRVVSTRIIGPNGTTISPAVSSPAVSSPAVSSPAGSTSAPVIAAPPPPPMPQPAPLPAALPPAPPAPEEAPAMPPVPMPNPDPPIFPAVPDVPPAPDLPPVPRPPDIPVPDLPPVPKPPADLPK